MTSWAMLVADRLGIALDQTRGHAWRHRCSCPEGSGHIRFRSLQSGGAAVYQAAEQVVEKATRLAADLLEANPDDIELDKEPRRFHVAGTPSAAMSWAELAVASRGGGPLRPRSTSPPRAPLSPSAPTSWWPRWTPRPDGSSSSGIVAVDDAGRIAQPAARRGPGARGPRPRGWPRPSSKRCATTTHGNPITANLADYAFVSAAELPSFETHPMETPTPLNPLGAKGIGESGTIGSTPAVQNAVVDALAHLGVRHVDMPTTPMRVWNAIEEARSNR